MRSVFVVINILTIFSVQGQSYNEIAKKYPQEDYVILRNLAHYRMKLVNDTPLVESRETEEWMYLSDNGAMMLKDGWIFHSGFHELKKHEAYTLTASGKKIPATDYKTTSNKSAGIFYDDAKVTNFKYPGLTKGAKTHLEYSTTHRNAYLLSPHYFSGGVPTIYNELKITVPGDIRIRYVIRGIDKDKVKVSEEGKKNEITYTFLVQDLPAIKRYPDAPKNPYFSTHVVFFIEKIRKKDGQWHNFLSSPDDLYRLYTGYVKDINKSISTELRQITDSLTEGKTSDKEKAVAIYSWVQNNIKYVAFEDGMEGFIPREANLVCSRRFGDCKDMASILRVMLKHAGLKAYYTWIGTRHLPYRYEETPTPIVDNHMICTVEINGEYIFLDGTDFTCPFGKPAEAIQDKEALVGIDENNYRIIKVPVINQEENILTDSTFISFTESGIRGTIKLSAKGYYATNIYGNLAYVQEKDKEKFVRDRLSRGSNKFTLSTFSIEKHPGNHNELSIRAGFEIPGYGNSIKNEKYINLNLVRHYENEEIDYPKRRIPVSFDFKSTNRHVLILNVPEGYRPDYIPDSKAFKNDSWGFSITYKEKASQIILEKEFINPHLMIEPEHFKDWNTVLEHLFPLYKESVSLVKK